MRGATLVGPPLAALLVSAAAAIHAQAPPDALPGEQLRTVSVRRYTLSGHIRPLLFWMGRDNVGLGRITWRRGDNGARSYELLVGTEPARAPRSLNRWGYISEEVSGANGHLLALMTGSDAASYSEAEKGASGGSNQGDFRAIRGRVQDGAAVWRVARVSTPAALTVNDVDATLAHVGRETAAAPARDSRVAPNVRPGFLVAVAELLDRAVEAHSARRDLRTVVGSRIQYVFGQRAYELQLRDADADTYGSGQSARRALHTSFEIRTLATGDRSRFEIVCGTEGDLKAVPLLIEWQPKWWLKLGLHLAEPTQGDTKQIRNEK
jgi:hypothetical protein